MFTLIVKTTGGSRTVATSKMEHFVIIVNGWNVAAVLDLPLKTIKILVKSIFTNLAYV